MTEQLFYDLLVNGGPTTVAILFLYMKIENNTKAIQDLKNIIREVLHRGD